jgi:hypothetical protein
MPKQFSVLDPTGYPPKVAARGLSQSPGDLDGRTVHLVDVGFENSDEFMRQLHGWMREHRPKTRTEVVRWKDQHAPDPELCTRIRAEADAAILGVGT